jgi:hypothetical protein
VLRDCAGCKRSAYCCAEHQRRDWPRHKPACQAAAALRTAMAAQQAQAALQEDDR